jgi:hypothetical protein
MRLTEARIESIAQAMVDRLAEEELVDLTMSEEDLAELISQVMQRDLAQEDVIQREAVEWLQVNRKHLQEGSDPWQIELEQQRDAIAIRKGYVLP